MVWKVRRVVTGHDSNGKSKLLMDGQARNINEMSSMPGQALTDLWETYWSTRSRAAEAFAPAAAEQRRAQTPPPPVRPQTPEILSRRLATAPARIKIGPA